jgi:Icc-related predicted phosphoesterase
MKIKHLNIQVQKLDIIVISDIHSHQDYMNKLAEHVRNNGLNFDYCFVGGDIVNCDHNHKTHNEEKETEAFRNIMLFLHDLFQCKIIFVPGNHDPLIYINGEPSITPDILNLHKKEYVLEFGLSIVGLGGSLPGYNDINYKNKVWEGYPYQSEE